MRVSHYFASSTACLKWQIVSRFILYQWLVGRTTDEVPLRSERPGFWDLLVVVRQKRLLRRIWGHHATLWCILRLGALAPFALLCYLSLIGRFIRRSNPLLTLLVPFFVKRMCKSLDSFLGGFIGIHERLFAITHIAMKGRTAYLHKGGEYLMVVHHMFVQQAQKSARVWVNILCL